MFSSLGGAVVKLSGVKFVIIFSFSVAFIGSFYQVCDVVKLHPSN